MSNDDELKWMTKRYSWRYIPDRYQAMVATVVSALLYYNAFNVLFSDRSTGDCGSFIRPKLDEDPYVLGWLWNTLGGENLKCSNAYFGGLFWEFLFTFVGLAICGLVMRRAIKRDQAQAAS
jgi:hypothetical protein